MNLKQIPVTELKGIGDKTAKTLNKLSVQSLDDLLWYIPRTYIRYPETVPISSVMDGETVAIVCTVDGNLRENNGRMLVTTFTAHDRTGTMEFVFFRQGYIKNIFYKGKTFVFYGTVKRKGYLYQMEMPEYYTPEEYKRKLKSLQPVYPLTKGISSKTIQKHVGRVIDEFFPLKDSLSAEYAKENDLIDLSDAFRRIHFPEDEEMLVAARKRLAFDEFYDFLKKIEESKIENTACPSEFVIKDFAIAEDYISKIPFELTDGQKNCFEEIKEDLSSGLVMRRLIQGDVGCGKTMVSFLAMTVVANAGYQAALMVPTEVLATQHFQAMIRDIENYNLPFKCTLLIGGLTAAKKRKALEEIASGEANLIIGTHAIFQEKVEFKNLALVITDEQHRFGVKQREMLAEKGSTPHVLVMSATPIPRTLTLTLYADLKVSIIRDMPKKRLAIKSCIIDESYRKNAYKFIWDEVEKGHQAYIICPMVEENEDSSLENVMNYPEKLDKYFGGRIRYGILHGRMKPAEKEKIMAAFGAHEMDVLISTTVIEVGIDVPNATVILIENAERFGLAQLHQLRGRVGRGDAQSYCVFLDGSGRCEKNERLKVLKDSSDGFHIAEEDLRLRGPGEINGLRQSGDLQFKIADIIRDYDILQLAKTKLEDEKNG